MTNIISSLWSWLAGIFKPATPALIFDFSSFSTAAGQHLWAWDWPSRTGGNWGTPGCARTVRPAPLTIFFVEGTWELFPGTPFPGAPAIPDPRVSLMQLMGNTTIANGTTIVPGENLIDWERIEVVKVPYPAAVWPMGFSVAQGTANLISLIENTPGKFVLMGGSQGGLVISNVLDELRSGSLKSRYADLVMGWAEGNMRKELGRTFPGGPLYCPSGYGCYTPTIQNTPDLWWEWSLPAGTYPAYGKMQGVTYAANDPFSCVGDATTADKQLRDAVQVTMNEKTVNILDVPVLILNAIKDSSGMGEVFGGFSPTKSPHVASIYEVQPFLANGDTRTYWAYTLDYINSLVDNQTKSIGVNHFWIGERSTVKAGQNVSASVWVEWSNMPSITTPAITLSVNAYDASGNLIGNVENPNTVVDNPASAWTWRQLSGTFLMPAGAVSAKPVVKISADAMNTATVWLSN